MRDTISSNTLFHFTKKLQYLKGILSEGFLPSYCLENFDIFKLLTDDEVTHFERAVPMVCFCDIPLSKAKSHMKTYGYYGIGLSKGWGIKSGVSPLFYVSGNSATTRSIYASIFYLRSNSNFDIDANLSSQYDQLTRLVRFTKPYRGKFYRDGKYINDVTFYNEREWRYIPDITDPKIRKIHPDLQPWLDKKTFEELKAALGENGKTQLFALNTQLRQIFPLPFKANVIRYIIVDKQSEIYPIVDTLHSIYKEKDATLLSSKILTKQQIFDDF